MIRVLHVVHQTNHGGIETLLMSLYRNIDREKIQFDFLKHVDEKGFFDDEIISLGGKIFSVPSRRQGFFRNRKALNNFFKTHKEYKIVHFHTSLLSYITPLTMAKKNNVPTRIIHSHNSSFSNNLFHNMLHSINQIRIDKIATDAFSCSDKATNWLFGKNKIRQRVKTINNGIIVDKFRFNPDMREIKRKELSCQGKTIIGHVGRFAYAKNHEFILQCFYEYLKLNSDSVLMLVGDGEPRALLETKAKELGIFDKTLFLGTRNDVGDLLNAFDLFFLPSLYEGFPVVLVEAQASGLPCLVSDSVTKQAQLTNETLYLSLTKSPEEWAKSMVELAKSKRVDKTAIIKAHGFDIKDVANSLADFYLHKGNQ